MGAENRSGDFGGEPLARFLAFLLVGILLSFVWILLLWLGDQQIEARFPGYVVPLAFAGLGSTLFYWLSALVMGRPPSVAIAFLLIPIVVTAFVYGFSLGPNTVRENIPSLWITGLISGYTFGLPLGLIQAALLRSLFISLGMTSDIPKLR